MSNVLIRNVPTGDLDEIRRAAAAEGTSMQEYLLQTLLARTAYLRRHEALARVKRRLDGGAPISEEDRRAAFDAFDDEIDEKARDLAARYES